MIANSSRQRNKHPHFRAALLVVMASLALPAISFAADIPLRAATTGATPAVAAPPGIEKSVVQIFSTMREPDPARPWAKAAPEMASGTGVVIEGKRILTNAHVVLYASQIQVQAEGSSDKFTANVAAIAPGIDLAVLTLDDPTFFDDHSPMARASALPSIKDPVMVYGYPTGGSSLSITKGIVSRIEFAPYNDSTSGLRVQIDAAINPGNSGGPAIAGDKMIGLAFSRLTNAQNIGYIIPNEEVELFLTDIADGHYDGKPAMFDDLQTLENPALRPFLKIDKSVHGIIVNQPFSKDPSYPLKQWDIITKIGDTSVDDQGKITVGDDLRLDFEYMVQKVAKDGKVPLTIVREAKEMKVELPVLADRPMVMPPLDGTYPSYYIFGPMVFTRATQELLPAVARNVAGLVQSGSPLITRLADKPAFPGEELVTVSSPFFTSKLAIDYSNPTGYVVKSVNGVAIKNLAQLIQVLNDSTDEFLTFTFAGTGFETFVFPRKAMLDSTQAILTDNDIRSQVSPDLAANAAAAAK